VTRAIVVGSGPNGLACAAALATEGVDVTVLEAEETIGGGTRTSELTVPGVLHDECSAVHPMASGSPFFKALGLERYGLEWSWPEIDLAHPLDDGTAGVMLRSIDETATGLGAAKAGSMGQVTSASEELSPELKNLIGTLHKGDLSPPAQAADGYLVFLCEDRQDTPQRTLADIRPQVMAAAQDQKRQRLFADWLDEREKKAAVKVASFYGQWNRERGAVN